MLKNTASQIIAFQGIATADGSPVTSGTPTVYVTGDGGAIGTGSGTSTHEGYGCWSYAPAQTETNYDHVVFTFVLANAFNVSINVYPSTVDYTDSVRAGLTSLPNAAADAAGGLPISDSGGLDLDAILADTNELQADDVPGLIAALDTVVDRVEADTQSIETKVDTIDGIVDAILVDTGTTLPATLVTIDNEIAVIDGIVDNILVDTAEIGTAGAGLTAIEASAPNLLLSTTINAVTDNQNFTLVAGPPDNDVMNGHMMKITDQTTGTQFATARIADYVASGFDVDLETSPGFTVAAGDIVEVFASPNRIALVDVVTTNSDMISAASVNAEVDTALSDYDAPTLAEVQTELGALNNVSVSQVRTQMDGALLDLHLDHLFASDYNPAVKPGVATSWANEMVVSDGGVTQFSANALELGPTGGSSSDATLLQSTTIATLASQTSWTLTAGSADNDVFNDRLCIITDQTTATQKCVVRITDYVGSSKTVTCSTPGFTVATGDTVEILAITALTESEVNAQADLALTDIGLDHLVSASVAGADVTDNSIVGQMVAADGDWDTFAKATDSLDAIGNTIAGTAGAGAYTVTINVKDTESSPANLENVAVRLTEGANVFVAQTNASGNAVFAIDAATYSYALTKTGYSGETGTTVVTGTGSFNYDIALNAITPSSGSLTATGVMVVRDENYALEQSVVISLQLTAGPGTAGEALDTTARSQTSDSAGEVQFTNLIRGATYNIWRGTFAQSSVFGSTSTTSGAKVSFVVPDAGSFNLPELLGADAS